MRLSRPGADGGRFRKGDAPANNGLTWERGTAGMTDEYDDYRIDQAERWLDHVRDLRITVRALQVDIQGEVELADGMRAAGGEHVSGTHAHDRMAETVARIDGMLDDLTRRLDELYAEVDEARRCIAGMPDGVSASLLIMRFIDGLTWDEVCSGLGYSFQHVMRLRRRALVEVYDVMPTRWRDPMQPAT